MFSIGVENRWFSPGSKRGTTLETKLLQLKHTTDHNSFYLGPPITASRLTFSNAGGLESTLSIVKFKFKDKHQETKPQKLIIPVAVIADFASNK